ncbi:LytTR family transcriptional regulator DNA-binding domain-containing protein [Cytobacillus firmus]|uniref:LytTR family transcriptional regulator DNA-binding domain-containing protein n=1 Tax=Cytobacillus firmus TaxID=1399 RepID=UPI001C8EE772|nr:LytTR family transcriptional regulator DNA-binding domain-containing protein [Cytobacillus firmus]MBX9975242.1 LytTR family transcriptional regulator DNA-binding domain-containing protein [Cytobacillus firmus]
MAILKINNLEEHDEHIVVFPPFCLEVSAGEVIAVHTNTNVMSVLLNMFMGGIPISNGEISVNGINAALDKRKFLANIGIFTLNDGLYERLTAKENFSFYKNLYGSEISIEEGLRAVQLDAERNRQVRKLSYSQKRRVHFGRLLFQNSALLILEEPDQNIDLETKHVFIKLIRRLSEEGKSILILTGNLESALSVTNRVYRLDETGLQELDVLQDEANTAETAAAQEQHAGLLNEETPAVQPVRFEKIPTRVNDKIILFDPPEIDYIESSEGQSNIFIKGEMYPSVFTLAELERKLHPYGFFRCHRSYIVNLQKVREVVTWTRNSFTLVLNDASKSSIPLSKGKMAELKEMLGLK